MTTTKMTLVDWLDDLCVRFIVNLPNEELQSVERICFQIEEAQWFYEDFIRPLDPNGLPSMHLRKFSQLMFQHCPLFSAYSEQLHQQAYEQFLAYKTRVPVRGAIMLNQDMTHAVLVKGWKKGAKWSFPRGKINKEEKDLDCAVREVWEETGYDLRATDLVGTEEDMKSITVTMREQSMMLFVFRGVPMDTHFEPRTRKEISKIDWYKLTDLPTLRRKNQAQQGNGQDLIKESSFYMVAPFLGPLRAWIKQQHKLDRQRARSSALIAPPVVTATDDEDGAVDSMLTTAESSGAIIDGQPSESFNDLIARLNRGHRPSDTLPEVSVQSQPELALDPAAELKRLLSVGASFATQPPIHEPESSSLAQQPPVNPLLALFRNTQTPDEPIAVEPQTAFHQAHPAPALSQSPHGGHYPRPPQAGTAQPPPPSFQFPAAQDFRSRGPQHSNGAVMHAQHQYTSLPQQQVRGPSIEAGIDPHLMRAFGKMPMPQAQHAEISQFAPSHSASLRGPASAVPSASNLPAPRLNAHTMGLLNSFKSNAPKAEAQFTPQQITPKMHQPLPQHPPHDLASPHRQFAPSPSYQSPTLTQAKPRTAHQDSLLTLFRPSSSQLSTEPAELSAHPTTPGRIPLQQQQQPSTAHRSKPQLLNTNQSHAKPPDITSATVRGPVNAPDFETVKKNVQAMSSSSRGPSPSAPLHTTQKPFMPQQILKRERASPEPSLSREGTLTSQAGTPKSAATVTATPQTAFKPQILKRPQQASKDSPAQAQTLLSLFKSPSPHPPMQGLQPPSQQAPSVRSPATSTTSLSFDRRGSHPSEQKNALLALFGKHSPGPASPPISKPLAPPSEPAIPSRSPHPPTPQQAVSTLISPVSLSASPAGAVSRSRISSIGEAGHGIGPATTNASELVAQVPGAPGIVIPPQAPQALGKSTDSKSPVDKTFLLGFLEGVARRGR